MTYDNDTGEVIAGMCRMWNLQTNYSRLYYQLPERWSDLNEIVCKSYHSSGTLCGECNVQDDYGPATMTYIAAHCVKCSDDLQHWVRFLASTFLPLTLILTFILGFGISIVSGSFNAFIFFALTFLDIYQALNHILEIQPTCIGQHYLTM